MKYGYISLEPIIAELQAQLKTMTKMGKFDDDDCYQYAAQCIRKIGCTEYDTVEEIVELKKHKVSLSKHIYLLEEVRLAAHCNDDPQTTTPIQVEKATFDFKNNMYSIGQCLKPVDNVTISFCKETYFSIPSCSINFSFKMPPGVLSCDLRDGLLYIKWNGLKRDDQGNLLIQDEENGIEAVKNFIKMQALEEDYYLQKIPKYIYDSIESKFYGSLSMAQAALLETGPVEMGAMVNSDRRKLDKFKLK